MGTDHNIILGWGYCIPLEVWNQFRKETIDEWITSERVYWKKRKLEDSYDFDDEGDMNSDDFNDSYACRLNSTLEEIEETFEKEYRFISHEGTLKNGEDGCVFLGDKEDMEYLFCRKIGGALAWLCEEFQDMQNISTLSFSIKLSPKEWMCIDEVNECNMKQQKLFEKLPEKVQNFLLKFPTEKYYSRWLFSYAS